VTLFSQLPAAVDEPKALRSYPNALDGQPPAELAARLFDNAMSIFNDPMAYWMRRQWESLSPEEVEEARDADWTPDDTADYLGIPQHGPRGEPLTERERYEWAFDVLDLVQHALELGGEGFSYQGPRSVRGWELAPGETAPRYLLEAAMADALSPQAKLRLVPVSKEAAARFIAEHHSKLPKLNPRGLLFVAGAAVGDRLVAVASMNTPSGPWKNPRNVVELTRVASDGTAHGAASKLTKRMIQLAPLAVKARGGDPARWRFITYSLSDEEGATYKALRKYGLRPTAMTPGKVSAGGQRGALASLAAQDKIRWEAGPGAAPADWTLVEAPPEPKETPMPSGSSFDPIRWRPFAKAVFDQSALTTPEAYQAAASIGVSSSALKRAMKATLAGVRYQGEPLYPIEDLTRHLRADAESRAKARHRRQQIKKAVAASPRAQSEIAYQKAVIDSNKREIEKTGTKWRQDVYRRKIRDAKEAIKKAEDSALSSYTPPSTPPSPKETPMPEAVKTTLITLANYLDNLAAQLRAGEDVDTDQAASFIERVEGVLARYA